jgi:predicted amidohydrolase YtcJ
MADLSRRDLLRSGAVVGGAAALGGLAPAVATAHGGRDDNKGGKGRGGRLLLTDGKIHTMDDRNRVVRDVLIEDGRFVEVGNHIRRGSDTDEIDLRGKTVVPGLIESHTHFVSVANRPGYHVAQLELASTIAEVLELLADRRASSDIPDGAFITAMGGGVHPNLWAERRLPTMAELDEAVPDRPVILFQRGNGPSVVNTLGKQFFETVTSPLAGPVVVGADGTIAAGLQSTTALYHLRVRQTFEDKKRSARDSMAFSAQVGITALLDQTLVAVGNGGPRDPQPTHGLPTLDHFRMYDGWIAAHHDGDALVRLQINFLHNEGFRADLGPITELDLQLPELRQRLKNQFQFFGDDMLRTGGIGEWAAPFALQGGPNPNGYAVWFEAQRLVAQAQWRNENSQGNPTNIQQVVETYEAMDAEFGIKHLRWGLQHGDNATPEQLERLKALNVAISTSGFRWQAGPLPMGAPPTGPLFPQLLASGIKLGLHEDGVHIAPHNPWYALHYATTGLGWFGDQINPGQQISRQQALHLYTRGNAWYLNRENELGSIERGKFADLLVLDRDYFRVSDESMRQTQPILTVVGGNIVYDTGRLRGRGR